MLRSGHRLGCWSFLLVMLGGACTADDAPSVGVELGGAPPPAVEESDLYRLDGSWLYVHSTSSGLNVIDVSEPQAPRLQAQLSLPGRAGELYVDADVALVLLEEAVPPCRLGADFKSALIATTSQLVAVEQATSAPRAGTPVCLPGAIVGSRKLGDFIYVVTSYEPLDLTWTFAIDVSSPGQLVVSDSIVMEGLAREILVSEQALYIAQAELLAGPQGTRLRYVSLDAAQGRLEERGSVMLGGQPAGRFHMDAAGSTFRIVTRDEPWQGSILNVLDFSDPDQPRVIGLLMGIAPGEELHATRFEGDRAYVVTYEAVRLRTDPLWVISLSDPRAPTIVGHLEIPGWSDYVFPRGQQLVAVGRGDRGAQVAVTLFDVSDPAAPAELGRVEFGDATATSEANTDFRAASIMGDEQSDGLVVVPYTNAVWEEERCVQEHHVQLVQLDEAGLTLRGNSSSHAGRVLRTLPIGDGLYTLSRHEVSVLDISDVDAPQVVAAVDVAPGADAEQCVFAPRDVQAWDGGQLACSISFVRSSPSWAAAFAALGCFGAVCMRRRRSRSANPHA